MTSEHQASDIPTAGESSEESPERRNFLVTLFTVVAGAICAIVPIVPGLGVLFDPLRRKKPGGEFIRVASFGSLPADGVPRRFPVIKDQIDHFNRFPSEPVGMVYLARTSDDKVTALQAECPHLGCIVDFIDKHDHFGCPCHASFFEADGERINPRTCPSPRALDSLEVDESRLADGEIWVEFKKFRIGTKKQLPA